MDAKSRDLYFVRKEKFVHKEFDTGFNSYQRLEGKIGNVRQWTITINVGFAVYVLSENKNLIMLFLVITIFMLILLLLELRTRSSMAFDKGNILKLERLFDEKNNEMYRKCVEEYKFRDERLSELTAITKLKHYFCSFFKGEVIVWYGMWILIWTSLIITLRWHWFKINLWIPILLAGLFIAISFFLICKYFSQKKIVHRKLI